ncbi:MAG: argininosuccinate synthase [Planctomycetota bacterium]|nr:MAG: argininosuccinate synthase [Planctomycetota bacterium]
MTANERIVLAFSGGLDTSFCVAWLREQHGAEVTTVCVDTGGFDAGSLAAIEQRALSLGAVGHHTIDARDAVWERFVTYVVKGQALRGGVYPVSVAAERTAQTEAVLSVARALGVGTVAHGSTGAGNDQVRFDVALGALAPELEVLAPVRALGWSRERAADWLAERGHALDSDTVAYSVNSGLVGTTIGGQETHDAWSMPPGSVYSMTVDPADAPDEAEELLLGFESGVARTLDGRSLDGPALLAELNQRVGAHGVGRGIHVGDTILGVKGRIAFEAPGPLALVTAHRELSKLVLTSRQAHWLRQLGDFWGQSLHEGLYHDPAMRDAEALLDSASARVSGDVRLLLHKGRMEVNGARSPHSLLGQQSAVYGEQTGCWSGADAAGFARLHGQAVRLTGARDRRAPLPASAASAPAPADSAGMAASS